METDLRLRLRLLLRILDKPRPWTLLFRPGKRLERRVLRILHCLSDARPVRNIDAVDGVQHRFKLLLGQCHCISNGQAQHADDAAQAPAAERSSKFSPRRCQSVNRICGCRPSSGEVPQVLEKAGIAEW